MCAAVSTDRRLERKLIEGVLNEENRSIAVSPGTDLVTVARYALRANRRRLVTDGVLFIILCAFILCALIMGGPGTGGLGLTAVLRNAGLAGYWTAWAVISLLVGAWAALFSERCARFVRSPSHLFVEVARTAMGPLRAPAGVLDGRGRWPGLAGFTRLAGRSLVDLPWRLLASGPVLAYRAVAPLRRVRNRRRADRRCDYAPRLSLREAASVPAGRYFQDADARRCSLLIEQQLLRSLVTFLADRNVAAPDLEPPGGSTFRSWCGRPAQHGQPLRNGQVQR